MLCHRVLRAVLLLLLLAALVYPLQDLHSIDKLRKLEKLISKVAEKRASESQDLYPETRLRRSPAQFQCTTNKSCYPPEFADSTISPDLIHCNTSTQLCACQDCFILLNDKCAVAPCHHYDNGSMKCVDDRRSQKTAFLLSVFLSSIGAANFYIGQNGLGAGQLALLVALLIAIYTLICVPCCILCCSDDDPEDMLDTLCFICFVILSLTLIVMLLFGIWSWWLADLVIFVQNGRNAGGGCPLIADL